MEHKLKFFKSVTTKHKILRWTKNQLVVVIQAFSCRYATRGLSIVLDVNKFPKY